MSVFRERFSCICDRWGLYRFYRAWKILSCGVLGLLEVSVSVPMLRFGDSRGCNCYGWDG